MLNKLFDLVDPLSFQHIFFYRLYCYHESGNILNQNVITCNKKLIFLYLTSDL